MIDAAFATELADRFGTPLYAYDLEQVAGRARALFESLPRGAELFYSLKANPLPSIVSACREAGCGGEISSTGELRSALDAGVEPDRLLYTGPGKSADELSCAAAAGVKYFSCESAADLDRVAAVARMRGAPLSVLLRVGPARPLNAGLAMAGNWFGFAPMALAAMKAHLSALTGAVDVAGFHVYAGTQIDDVGSLISSFGKAVETIESLAEALDLVPRVIDLGGGFPWPYATPGAGPDLHLINPELTKLLDRRVRTANAAVWFESGRYLCASSGTLLTRVVDVKTAEDGSVYVVMDAGINHLGGMSGLGRLLQPRTAVQPLESRSDAPAREVDVVGPLCSPLDRLAYKVRDPGLRPGDLAAVPNVGAYGLTASLVGFLSRPAPAEVAFRGGRVIDACRLRLAREALV